MWISTKKSESISITTMMMMTTYNGLHESGVLGNPRCMQPNRLHEYQRHCDVSSNICHKKNFKAKRQCPQQRNSTVLISS